MAKANWQDEFLAQRRKQLEKTNSKADIAKTVVQQNGQTQKVNPTVKQSKSNEKIQNNADWNKQFLNERRKELLSNEQIRENVQQSNRIKKSVGSFHDYLIDRERQQKAEQTARAKEQLFNKYISPVVAPSTNKDIANLSQGKTLGTDPLLRYNPGKLTPVKMHEISERVAKKQGDGQVVTKTSFDLNLLKESPQMKDRHAFVDFGRASLQNDINANRFDKTKQNGTPEYEYGDERAYTGIIKRETIVQKQLREHQQDFRYLTKEEQDNYLYIYGAYGKNKANQYFDEHLQETINHRKALEYMRNERTKQGAFRDAQDMQSAFISGAERSVRGINDAYVALLGGDNTSKKSVSEFRNEMIRRDAENSGIKNVALDVTNSIGNMAPAIVAGALSGGLGASGAVSTGISSTAFGLSAGGNAYNDSLREGKSLNQARLYAAQQAVDEVVTNYLLNGVAAFGGGKLGNAMKNSKVGQAVSSGINRFISSRTGKAVVKNAGELLINMGEEAAQEYVQNYTDKIARNLIFGEKNEIRFDDPDALYAAMLGATTAGIMNMPAQAANQAAVRNLGEQIHLQEFSRELDGVNAIIEQSQNPKVRGKAEQVKKQIEIMMEREHRGMPNSAYSKGMLADEINEVFTLSAQETEKMERDGVKLANAREFYTAKRGELDVILESTNNEILRKEAIAISDKLEAMAKDNFKRLKNSKFAKNNLEKRLNILAEKVNNKSKIQPSEESKYLQSTSETVLQEGNQKTEQNHSVNFEELTPQELTDMDDTAENKNQFRETTKKGIDGMSDEEYEQYLEEYQNDDEVDYVEDIDRLDDIENNANRARKDPDHKVYRLEEENGQGWADLSAVQAEMNHSQVERIANDNNLPYRNLEERSKQFNAYTAKAYKENYDSESGIPINTYDEAFKIVYNKGRYAGAASDVKSGNDVLVVGGKNNGNVLIRSNSRIYMDSENHPQLAFLTPKQMENIFAAGVRDRITEGKTKTIVNTPHEGGFVDNGVKGHENLKQYLRKWGKFTGLQFALVDSLPEGTNGAFDKENGIVYISTNTKSVNATIGHELTHFMQEIDTEGYNIIRDGIIDQLMQREDSTLEDLIERYASAYLAAGQELTRDEVIDEIVADSAVEFLNDKDFIDGIIEQKSSFAKKILDYFKDLIESIKGFIQDVKNNAVVTALKDKQEFYETLRDVWMERLKKAGTDYKSGNYKLKTDGDIKVYSTKFSISPNLEKELEKISNNDFSGNGGFIHIGKTSNFLSELLDLDEIDVYMQGRKARTIMATIQDAKKLGFYKEKDRDSYHNLGKDLLFKALKSAENPLMAMVAEGESSAKNNRVMLVTDLADRDGNPIIVIQELMKDNYINTQKPMINQVVTVYGKKMLQKKYFDAIRHKGILFVDKNRGGKLKELVRIVQFNTLALSDSNLNNNIQRFQETIKGKLLLSEYNKNKENGKITKDILSNAIEKGWNPEINKLKKSIDVNSDVDIEQVQRKNETLRAMNTILKKRLNVKGDYLLKPNEINAISENILKETNSSYSQKKLNAGLTKIFTYLAKSNGKHTDAAVKVATDIMHDVLQQSESLLEPLEFRGVKDDIKRIIKKTTFKINPMYKGEFIDEESVLSLNRKYFRTMTISYSKGRNIDDRYAELSEMYPGFFPDNIVGESEQLKQIIKVLEDMKPRYVNEFQADMEEASQYYASDILNKFVDVSEELGSKYKNLSKRMEALRTSKSINQAARQQLLDDISELEGDYTDAKYEDIDEIFGTPNPKRKNIKDRIKNLTPDEQINLIQQAYENANNMRLKYKQEFEQRRREYYERNHIARVEERQKKKERRNQNELLKQARMLSRIKGDQEFEKKKMELIGELDLEAVRMLPETKLELSRFLEWSENLEETDDFYIHGAKHQKALRRLQAKQIKDLTASEVAALTQSIIELRTAMENEKKLLKEENEKTIAETAELLTRQQEKVSTGIKSNFKHLLNKFLTFQLDPIRAFKFFSGYQKDSVLVELTKDLNEGQLGKTAYTKGAYEIFDKLLQNESFTKDLKTLNIPITGKDGETAYISKAMRISIMLHSKHNDNMRHIVKGGLTVPDKAEYEKGNISRAYRNGKNIVLGKSMVDKIVASATKEEWEFVKLARKYFDEYAAKEINKTTNVLLGHDRATVKNYFPIISNPDYLESESQGVFMDNRFHNARELKERTKGTNPILLEDVTERLVREINNTGNYVNLAIPLRNFKKVMNHRSFASGQNNSLTVKAFLDKEWDGQISKYFDDLVADIEGARKTESSFLDRLRGKFAGAVLSANLSVTMQQLSAYPTAAAVIGYKPLIKAFAKGGKAGKMISAANREEINKYSPLMWYREQGNRSTELGEIAKFKTLGVQTKLQEFTSEWLDWVGKSDNAVVGRMWDASKYYVSDNIAVISKQNGTQIQDGSDEYFKEVAKIFNRIVEETQSNYTTMQRAPILRTSNQTIKALTMFYTQRAQNFGIMFDAFGEYKARIRDYKLEPNAGNRESLRESKIKFQRAMTSQVIASAMGAALKLIAAMILGKMKKYKDDKGDVSGSKVMLETLSETFSSMAGNILFGSELYQFAESIATGGKLYDVESPSISNLNGIMQNTQSFVRSIQDLVMSEDGEKEQNLKKVKKNAYYLSLNISQATSIPLKNVLDLSNAVATHTVSIFEQRDIRDWYFKESDVKESKFYDKVFHDFYTSGDYSEFTRDYQKAVKMYGKEKASKAMTTRLRDTEEVLAAATAMNQGDFQEVQNQKEKLLNKFSNSKLLVSFVDTSIQKEYEILQKETNSKMETPDEEVTPVMNEKSKEWTQNGYEYLEFVYYSQELSKLYSDKGTDGKIQKTKQEKVIEYLKNLSIDEAKKRILWSSLYKGEYLKAKN